MGDGEEEATMKRHIDTSVLNNFLKHHDAHNKVCVCVCV